MTQLLDISFVYIQGKGANGLIYEIKRRSDGLFYDFTNSVFSATPANQQAFLPETPANVFKISGSSSSTPSGCYESSITLTGLGAQYTDGDFKIYVWDISLAQMCGFAVVTITDLDAAVVVADNPGIAAGGRTTDGFDPVDIISILLAIQSNPRTGFPVAPSGGQLLFMNPDGTDPRATITYDSNANILESDYNPPS